jgi:hypothetical protein
MHCLVWRTSGIDLGRIVHKHLQLLIWNLRVGLPLGLDKLVCNTGPYYISVFSYTVVCQLCTYCSLLSYLHCVYISAMLELYALAF